MFFQKKVDRAMEWNRNKGKLKGDNDSPETDDEHIELERKDIAAIIISAFLVFGPIFLVLGGIVFFVYRLL